MIVLRAHLKKSNPLLVLLSLLFFFLPFQRRFHGVFDSFSRSLTLPDFPLPEAFSTKVHFFITDPLILLLTLLVFFRYKVSLRTFFWGGPSKYLTLLFFTALTSIVFSKTSHYSLQYFRLFEFSSIFLVFNSIRCAREKLNFPTFINGLAWIFLTISCFECLLSLYQYFMQQPLGLRILGELNPNHFPFPNPGNRRWLFDKLQSSSSLLYRASGTFPHPNILGGFLLCSLLATYHLCMQRGRYRLLLFSALFLQIMTLYISFSRAAMLAVVFSTLIYGLLQLRHILQCDGIRSQAFKRYAIVAGTVILGALIGLTIFLAPLMSRGGIVNYNVITQGADTERLHYQKIAIDMIKEHPLTGVGFNNFEIFTDPIQESHPGLRFFTKVHNIYLLIASETGLLGGIFFFAFLFTVLKRAAQALSSQAQIFLLSTFIGMLFIGMCDFYFLHTPHGRLLFFGFAALLYVIQKPPQKWAEDHP